MRTLTVEPSIIRYLLKVRAYEELLAHIWKEVGRESLTPEDRTLMAAIASRLHNEPAAIHCGGMGVVGPGLFYSLSGVAITYMVILYQNRPPE